MPRLARNVQTQRLNLEVSTTVRQRLEDLRDETEAESMTQVIGRALAVYDFLWHEKKRGALVVVKTGEREKELVLL